MRISIYPVDEIASRLATMMEARAANGRYLREIDLLLGGDATLRTRKRRSLGIRRAALDALREGYDRQMVMLSEATHLALGIPHRLAISRELYFALSEDVGRHEPGTKAHTDAARLMRDQLDLLRTSCDHAFVYGFETLRSQARACAVCLIEELPDDRGRYALLADEYLRVYRRMSKSQYAFHARILERTDSPAKVIDLFTTDEILSLLRRLRSPS